MRAQLPAGKAYRVLIDQERHESEPVLRAQGERRHARQHRGREPGARDRAGDFVIGGDHNHAHPPRCVQYLALDERAARQRGERHHQHAVLGAIQDLSLGADIGRHLAEIDPRLVL